ncbi:nuclease-related domain-containing protein [Cytobacillus praedii]|uniref:NERD domain-containing protein n=1 Tax=Cytobacillus praedii TaxID=1742358 RepID=A0A4R1B3D6_9BACI|nr:nuclease-related domain-containing protein [Cytobacillus praedii]TCJ04725.1 NERD domain-containing protein [Cytobacillus praedii]
MIVKPRKIPLSIRKLEALIRRLPPYHPKLPLISDELNKKMAGYKGESSLDFYLGFLDPKQYFIFHDLRLRDDPRFFQIDTLIVTKSYLLIIEVKNIAGTIHFDPLFNQLIRIKDGKEMAFPDPLIQVKRHELQLKKWFRNNGLKELPICSFIVISNPQTVIRTTPENSLLSQKVIHREALPSKIIQFENSLHTCVISEKELKKAIRLIKKQHTELDSSIMDKYNISRNELIKGVLCKNCLKLPLERKHGTWFCSVCLEKCNHEHKAALNDYRLLISKTITNSQLRDFLKIESAATATRILHSMNIPYSGINKGRVYQLPLFEE